VAFCRELEKLLDAVPPFPTAEAIAIIEKETERPLAANFRAFEPVPIGSASLACVFKAELLDGQAVAIKVRRPDVATRLAADLKALTLLAAIADLLGRVKIRPIVGEIVRMLVDELNFKLEAQHILHFRKALKRQKKVCVPKVHYHLCTCRLLVVEFVTGVSMVEVLQRAGSEDPIQRAQWEAEGYDGPKIARRLARFFYWELFDGVFFHADPHPGNIIIGPGPRIHLIDFGSCGSLPQRLREALLGFNLAVSRHDLEEATRCLRTMHEPLPPLVLEDYVTEMRQMMQKTFLEVTNKKANWRERTVSVAISESLAISRKYRIPMNFNLLRYFRMVFLSDTILFRLNPRFSHQKEVIAWYGERQQQRNREVIKECNPFDFDLAKLRNAKIEVEQLAKRLKNRFEDFDSAFRATISKSSYAAKVLIVFAGRSVSLGICFIIFRMVWSWFEHRASPYPSLVAQFHWLTSNRYYMMIVLLMAVSAIYNIYARVRQVDAEER
jgi:predicted unusual protein kinase regulating ubiquinone biosynthesis (AarF/ABC1/UbiB family)